jgi:hypothetical protein
MATQLPIRNDRDALAPSRATRSTLPAAAMDIELHLCALDPQMLQAWSRHFSGAPNVSLDEGDILARTDAELHCSRYGDRK